ncbi:alpha/beta fold hydrolase [Jiangella mangrovi]|uniref:Pimeloyl-ACP methyl ester carboxylesterase n=1 Tax=Jiangella mangrovi TaxID=1524084 RepID=A0A7W9GN92_9ACTN|nr:alpha/beta hydrolase [Jiangella mangrovi]MBB5786696.1 pimeloyl-ACP methyl ester carboxylesterase [Jiangella mangrovi]
MPSTHVNGVDLAYDDAGSGPAVILVHGALGDRRMWDHQFAALADRHRVVRYDWRGHGESGDAAGEFAHHADLLGLMDALGIERAALAGNSYGGAHSLDVALAAPERVTALVLVASGLSGHEWPPEMLQLARERILAAVPAERLQAYRDRTATHVDPADVAAMAEAQLRLMAVGPGREPGDLGPEVWEHAMTMCRLVFDREWSGPASTELGPRSPAKGRLHEVAAPTLVINGRADLSYIQDVSGLLSAGIPGAKRVDLDDTGHLPSIERPVEVTALLTGFLAGPSQAG